MVEPKVSLSMLVPGIKMLSSQECDKNPNNSYDESTVTLSFNNKGKKETKKTITIKTRKQRLITHNLNINKEAYDYMLNTSTSAKYNRVLKRNSVEEPIERVWDVMSVDERLKKHFDLIAHDFNAESYSYQILED